MKFRRNLQKRAVSVVLAIAMVMGCTFNTAAAESGASEDTKSFDSGNVTMTSSLKEKDSGEAAAYLAVKIKDLDEFLGSETLAVDEENAETQTYEVRYDIPTGYALAEKPDGATVSDDESYVFWRLPLDKLKGFHTEVPLKIKSSVRKMALANEEVKDTGEQPEEDGYSFNGMSILLADATAAVGDELVSIPVNLYNYNTTTVNRTRVINAATQNLLTGTRNRALYFNTQNSTTTGSGSWNIYYDRNNVDGYIYPGIVKTDLSGTGDLQFSDQYAQSNFFGDARNITINGNSYTDKTVYRDANFQFRLDADGYYTYDSDEDSATFNSGTNQVSIAPQEDSETGFWPFDTGSSHKYSFGMSMGIDFTIPKDGLVNGEPMRFDFSGDDDVWVFLDGKLALDIGGIHGARAGSIDFSTGIAQTDGYITTNGTSFVHDPESTEKNIYSDSFGVDRTDSKAKHTLKIFYMERGDGDSNCKIRFNIPTTSVVPVSSVTTGKTATAADGYNDPEDANYRTYNIGLTASADSTNVTSYKKVGAQSEDVGDGPWYADSMGKTQIYKQSESVPRSDQELYWFTEDGTDVTDTITGRTGSNPLYTKSDYGTVTSSYVNSHKDQVYYILTDSDPLTYSRIYYKSSNGRWYPNSGLSGPTYYIPANSDSGSHNRQFYQKVDTYTAISKPSDPDEDTEYYIENSDEESGFAPVHFRWLPETENVWYSDSGLSHRLSTQPTDVYVPESEEVGEDLENAIVRDYIDPRFIVVDEHGDAIEDGEEVADGGILHIGDDQTYVEWTDQTIPAADDDSWQASFYVKAKDSFIGGNDIPTNGDGAGDGKSGVYQEDESGTEKKLGTFTSPTVNVPVKFTVGTADETIFYGERIQAGNLPTRMFDEIRVDYIIPDGETGTFSYRWYSDSGCTQLVGNGSLTALQGLTPSDNTQYYLQVSFTPNSDGTDSEEHGGAPVGIVNEKNAYAVAVVKGELDLTKTITDLYPSTNPDNGAEQSFVFKITRADELNGAAIDTFYEVITPNDTQGTTQRITGLKKGYYTVTEESGAWRYQQSALTDNDGANDGKVFIGNHITDAGDENLIYFGAQTGSTACTPNPAAVQFTNGLTKKNWFSDTTVVINTVTN